MTCVPAYSMLMLIVANSCTCCAFARPRRLVLSHGITLSHHHKSHFRSLNLDPKVLIDTR